jgi:signal transduction histidine kinase
VATKIDNGVKKILISDNGNGIPSEEISKIFDKFYQVESNFTGQTDGWGLGLTTVRNIIELHKFNIDVKSEINQGTSVTISVK